MDITYCKKNKIVSIKMNFTDRYRLKSAIGEEDFDYLWNLMDNIRDAAIDLEEERLVYEAEPSGEEVRAWYDLTETN